MKNSIGIFVGLMMAAGISVHASDNQEALTLFSFKPGADIRAWEVEDDGVMGGRSEGQLELHEDGYAVYSGTVSLDNNGGFSSIQYYFEPLDVSDYRTAHIRLKGDGRRYLLLVEDQKDAWHYYVGSFETSGEWETVTVRFSDMEPVRRGDKLDLPNFPGQTLAQVRIMIANQVRESFTLEIERIWLE